jgi:hypothetical protein
MNYDNAQILDWHFNTSSGVAPRDAIAALGFIPTFVFEADPRPAHEQFAERYIGGWNEMLPSDNGWKLDQNNYLHYPGDPPMAPLASAMLRDEQILVYPYAFVCVVQKNGAFTVVRMD